MSFEDYKTKDKRVKNLKNLEIHFDKNLNYATLVGLNGSGKSNILEAMSEIFYYLYETGKGLPSFYYEIEYTKNIQGKDIYITRNKGEQLKEFNGEHTQYHNQFTDKFNPSRVIACYSGEDTRLYNEIYLKSYIQFTKKVSSYFHNIDMIYIDKKCWDIALASLLYSAFNKHNKKVLDFLEELFKNIKLSNISFNFDYRSNDVLEQAVFEATIKKY